MARALRITRVDKTRPSFSKEEKSNIRTGGQGRWSRSNISTVFFFFPEPIWSLKNTDDYLSRVSVRCQSDCVFLSQYLKASRHRRERCTINPTHRSQSKQTHSKLLTTFFSFRNGVSNGSGFPALERDLK